MSKKSFLVILILSIIITYGIAYVDFLLSISKGSIGLPFGFSRFNFLRTETKNIMLLFDIAFWFVIVWGILKLIKKSKRK